MPTSECGRQIAVGKRTLAERRSIVTDTHWVIVEYDVKLTPAFTSYFRPIVTVGKPALARRLAIVSRYVGYWSTSIF